MGRAGYFGVIGTRGRTPGSVLGRREHSAFTGTSRAEPVGTDARPHDYGVTDEQPNLTTVHDRLIAAGLSDERIAEHMTAGRVRVDGELVTDLDTPAPGGTRVVVWAE